jgi:hypothetical protein
LWQNFFLAVYFSAFQVVVIHGGAPPADQFHKDHQKNDGVNPAAAGHKDSISNSQWPIVKSGRPGFADN